VNKVALFLLLVLIQACSATGLLPATGDDVAVAIPRVILNCQTANCRTNVSGPRINVTITRSACTDTQFDAIASVSTFSISCTGIAGCYGEVSGWVNASGSPVSSLSSGIYNICGCINYTNSGVPWNTCNSLGTLANVQITSGTGLKNVTGWIDQ
jgi:hypothetical protein